MIRPCLVTVHADKIDERCRSFTLWIPWKPDPLSFQFFIESANKKVIYNKNIVQKVHISPPFPPPVISPLIWRIISPVRSIPGATVSRYSLGIGYYVPVQGSSVLLDHWSAVGKRRVLPRNSFTGITSFESFPSLHYIFKNCPPIFTFESCKIDRSNEFLPSFGNFSDREINVSTFIVEIVAYRSK